MSSKTKTTATKEEATPALVPKLRFPEFRGEEEWEYSPLGKLLMKSPDYGVNAAAVPFTDGLPQYLRITDISDEGAYLSAKKVSVDITPTEEIFLDEGDIVLARTGASVGKSYRYRKEDGRLVFAGFLIRVTPNPKRLDSIYLGNFLTTNQYWRWVAATSARSGQPGINSVEYSSLEIPLPADFAEQQKIASCLSSVDELIAAQARKVDALKTHKKGLMQQLFPREGETQPRLRFPDFQNAGEWEEKAFSELCDIKHGYAFESEFFTNEGDYVLLTPGNFYEEGGYRDRGEKQKYFTGEIPRDYVLTGGDMLIAMTEQAVGLLGSPILVPESDKFLHNQRLGLVTKKPGVAWVNEFFFNVLNTQSVRKAIHDTASGAKVRHTSPSKVGDVVVSVPTTPAEQQRIANCLNSLDSLIAVETQKLEVLMTHKKGLMHQLFPSPEEPNP
jgi:type I restriction enzyme S subunit